ncbi:MAG: TIGR02281 family clan AA aspartic protease [Pseudomonadota bacterium]
MSGDDLANFTYLGVLLVVIAGGMLTAGRFGMGQLLRGLLTWVALFAVVILGYGVWQDITNGNIGPLQATAQQPDGDIVVPRSRDGHFYLTLTINDAPVRFVVDTGATDMVLSEADAARVGINLDSLAYTGQASTANGIVRTARVFLDEVTLGGITDRGVRASVNGGALNTSLLGMSYLSRFDTLQIQDGRLTLVR